MTSPLSEEKPQRWDELLEDARRYSPFDGTHTDTAALLRRLADALQEERDNLDSSREYAGIQEAVLTDAALEIDRLRQELVADAEARQEAVDGPLTDRLHRKVVSALPPWSEVRMLTKAALARSIVAAIRPVITAEVSARVSEAQIAVPEPLALGVVSGVRRIRPDEQMHHQIVVDVYGDYQDLPGRPVGIWPEALVEQVVDADDERIGLRNELAAMTAVAKRFRAGWEPDEPCIGPPVLCWFRDANSDEPEAVTDSERRALNVLDRLSEGESE